MLNSSNTYFILNPTAGKGKGLKMQPKIEKMLTNLNISGSNLKITEFPGHATELANASINKESSIFCIGGDGTLNEVINGLNNHVNVSLGVIPIGSGNDFARGLGILEKGFSLERYIQSNKKIVCDIGHVQIFNGVELILDKKFISSLGIGFDALVAYNIRSIKVLKGLALYISSVILSLFKYKAPKCTISSEELDLKLNDKIFLFAVGNTETAGGGFKLNPGATIDDGYLNLCFAKNISKLTVLKILPRAITGDHVKDDRVYTYKFKSLNYKTSDKIYIHIDGEAIQLDEGEKKIVISVSKTTQKVIVNEEY
ncbi:MAG: diacylglycerol kinase family lipid kinase [Ignavibacteria bacterium]|nr:diacylglycerol kinase family lipid kinase [Ignavibacteria bacterium]